MIRNSASRFQPGTTIIRREVLLGLPWLESPVTVVADDGDVLAVLLQPGSTFTFHDHPHGPHPWSAHQAWSGAEVLQLHRTGDAYAVWMFFDGGTFRYWYINFEAPVTRWEGGFDTDDHGLDLIVRPDGTREWKDVNDLSTMRREGRSTDQQILDVLEAAEEVWDLLDQDQRWWSPWDSWEPASTASRSPR